MRGRTEEYNCKNCHTKFIARVADRARGWSLFCSKRCKAKKQEQYRKIINILKTYGEK